MGLVSTASMTVFQTVGEGSNPSAHTKRYKYLILVVLVLAGCGKRELPYLPEEEVKISCDGKFTKIDDYSAIVNCNDGSIVQITGRRSSLSIVVVNK